MLDYQEYLRYKALCEAFDAADPATYFDVSPALRKLLDEQAAKYKAEFQARVAAQTPADYDRWDTPLGMTQDVPGQHPTPAQAALIEMLNTRNVLLDLAKVNGWEPVILKS